MSEVNNNINYQIAATNSDNGLILEAHNSSKMKVERPKFVTADFSQKLLTDKTVHSKKEADNRLKIIDNDIYQGTKKEKDKHDFNFKRYFTIFGILILLTTAFGYFRKK